MILLLGLAAIARFYQVGAECFWIDELFSLQTAAGNGLAHERLPGGEWIDPSRALTDPTSGGGIGGIVRHAHEDTQAPLYYIALNLWQRATGGGETAVRSLSVVFSLVSVGLTFLIVRRIDTRQTALIAAAVMAVSGVQIVFAQEARPYAMALALALAAAWAMIWIERGGITAGRVMLLAASCLLLVLTHYLGVAAAAAVGVYGLIRLRGRNRAVAAGAMLAAALAFAAMWGWVLVAQARHPVDRLGFLQDKPAGHVLRTLDRAVAQPLLLIMTGPGFAGDSTPWRWVARAVGAAAIVLLPILLRRRRELLLPWLLMLLPITATAVSDLLSTKAALELPRFSFLASAGVCATLALLVTTPRRPGLQAILAAGLIGLTTIGLVAPAAIGRPSAYSRQKPDMRPMARYAEKRVAPGDLLLLARQPETHWQAGTVLVALSHYIGETGAPPRWPGPVIVLDGPPDPALLARIRGHNGAVWMLSPTPSLPVQWVGAARTEETSTVRNMGTLGKMHWPAEPSPDAQNAGGDR